MASYNELAQSVISGNEKQVKEQTQSLIDAGNKPLDIINEGLIGGMNVVGSRFKAGDMFVPEVLMSARAMAAGVELVKPLLPEGEMGSSIKVVLGTVKGDLHDIGKNLVGMMMESSGLQVIDLGVDVAPEKFIQSIRDHKPAILGLSALLTTTMGQMKDIIELLGKEGLRGEVKVIIGGAPISQAYADEIGADGFAADAASAADLCKELAS